MVSIEKVETEGIALEDARTLFKEYLEELNEDLFFQSFDDELAEPLKKYGPPLGCLFIAYNSDEAIACIALQPLKENGVGEMKRLYVKPAYRKTGIGDDLVQLLLKEAKQRGYTKMVLDTLDRLQPAIRLYARNGFINTSAYYHNPLPGVVYMQKEL